MLFVLMSLNTNQFLLILFTGRAAENAPSAIPNPKSLEELLQSLNALEDQITGQSETHPEDMELRKLSRSDRITTGGALRQIHYQTQASSSTLNVDGGPATPSTETDSQYTPIQAVKSHQSSTDQQTAQLTHTSKAEKYPTQNPRLRIHYTRRLACIVSFHVIFQILFANVLAGVVEILPVVMVIALMIVVAGVRLRMSQIRHEASKTS